ALPHEEEADAEDVDEHAVEAEARREAVVEQGVERGDGDARSLAREEERRARRLGAREELGHGEDAFARSVAIEGLRSLREDDAAEAEAEEAADGLEARVVRELLEVRELGLSEDLDARRNDAVEVAGEGEAGLLDACVLDGAEQARRAAHERNLDAEAG